MSNNLISVTRVLQAAGLYDFSKVPSYVMDAACKFGTATHKATELWDKGILDIDTLSAPLVPRLEAWKKFRVDYRLGEFLHIEKELISAKWGFCGHPDRIVAVNKTMVDIYDIKTSEQANPVTALQLAGYSILIEENLKLKIRNRWCILLGDGTYKIEPYNDPHDRTVFISCLNLVRWRERNLK